MSVGVGAVGMQSGSGEWEVPLLSGLSRTFWKSSGQRSLTRGSWGGGVKVPESRTPPAPGHGIPGPEGAGNFE